MSNGLMNEQINESCMTIISIHRFISCTCVLTSFSLHCKWSELESESEKKRTDRAKVRVRAWKREREKEGRRERGRERERGSKTIHLFRLYFMYSVPTALSLYCKWSGGGNDYDVYPFIQSMMKEAKRREEERFRSNISVPCICTYIVSPLQRCSVLQCVEVRWSVLRCVSVCCSVLQCVAVRYSVLQPVEVYCSVLQCVAVCCSVLQCVAVRCSVLQCITLQKTKI